MARLGCYIRGAVGPKPPNSQPHILDYCGQKPPPAHHIESQGLATTSRVSGAVRRLGAQLTLPWFPADARWLTDAGTT